MIILNKDAKIICDRIDQHFHPRRNHQYHIDVVNVEFLGKFNFFYKDMSKTERQRSIPLHSVESQDIEHLQQILRGIREHTNLSFEFHGFINGERWASNDRIIERQPSEMELSDGNPF
ncbi:acetyl-CoA carboxyl transferase [Lacticaseibacillus paracasei]|uniref:acetyl-CoA carboxyl transferase n=1 Tax=Lacticaseibacillus paracasei TaxID=1597 RepID=UPI0031F6E8A6